MKITTIVSLAVGLAGWQATVQARDVVSQARKGASPSVAQASPDTNMVLIPASQARDIQRATREVSDCVRIEDDVVVNADGTVTRISEDIPRTIADVEEWIARVQYR